MNGLKTNVHRTIPPKISGMKIYVDQLPCSKTKWSMTRLSTTNTLTNNILNCLKNLDTNSILSGTRLISIFLNSTNLWSPRYLMTWWQLSIRWSAILNTILTTCSISLSKTGPASHCRRKSSPNWSPKSNISIALKKPTIMNRSKTSTW